MIFTSLSPNTQKDDILLSLKLLLNPFDQKKYRDELIKQFNEKLGLKNSFGLDSARNGLYLFLKTLNLQKTDEVLLQAYTCTALVNPILWIGAKPKYIDCNRDDFNINIDDLEKKITKNSRVLIIQHTFGNPANLDKLLKIAKKNNLIVIEDCAHSLGAKYGEKFTGSFGDAAIYSLGRDKVISSTSGGILTINNQKFLEQISKEYSNLNEAKNTWTTQQLIHPIILSIAKGTYNFFKLGRLIIKLSLNLKIISNPICKSEKKGIQPNRPITKLSNRVAALASHQLSKLDLYNSHRINLAKKYYQLLDSQTPKPDPTKNPNSIFTRYTILADNPSKIYKDFIQKNIQLGTWFDNVIMPKDTNLKSIQYTKGSCPNAEFLSSKSLNLPNGIQINEKDVQKVAKLINKTLQ